MPIDLPPPIIGIASIIDGDTIDIHGTRIRLFGIDAPESRQICQDVSNNPYMCGNKSANYLDAMLRDKSVKCVPKTIDRYQRIVAHCFIGSIDIQAEMVRQGQAMAFIKYSREYINQEQEACKFQRGIWQGQFVAPWDFRKNK